MRIVQGVFWWGVTILTLLVLDDLLFGPIFWVLALVSPVLSTVTAFAASLLFQNWLIAAGIGEHSGRVASFLLQRLMLARKNGGVAEREQTLRQSAASILGAVSVTPLIGAIIPVLFLRKYNFMNKTRLRAFAFLLSVIYACEFALIHGGYGLGGLVRLVL